MSRILFLGEIAHGQTSQMRMRALQRLGHTVEGINTIAPWRELSWLSRQVQRRAQLGPVVNSINLSVLQRAREFQPEMVWAEKQEYLWPETVEALRRGGALTVHFTPDPYFTLDWKRTRLMDAAIGSFDVLVYCKRYEEADYARLGKPLVYMPLGFCDEVHRPLTSQESRWHSTIGFLGGWEPRRETMLTAVARTVDNVKIWGGLWEFLVDGRWSLRRYLLMRQQAGSETFRIARNDHIAAALQGNEVYGDDYARALSGAAIGLGFLRKVCPDQHTTRTFEIPACGSLLLADRTDEHCDMFVEGQEAEFFGSLEELLDKARFYARGHAARRRIAAAGLERVRASGAAYVDRMRSALVRIAKSAA